MTTSIDIKVLAQEIAKEYPLKKILSGCKDLIGECGTDIDEHYTIELAVKDGFLGYDEWVFDIRITPYVSYDYYDCDRVISSIMGIDFLGVYSVSFSDQEGNEYEFDEKQLEELQNELEDAIYEA